jgi:putative nucleotidyltransferase with HDIG domain
MDVDSFRRHSLACAVTARVLAAQRGEDNIERFFVAGLLHDIGRLLLALNAPQGMRAALDQSQRTHADLRRCEREQIGYTHDLVGELLLERWQFPEALREAVRFHHEPQRASRFPMEAAAAHVADVVAHGMAWGRSGQPIVPTFDAWSWETLGLDVELTPIVIEEAERQLEAAMHLIPDAAAA